MTWKRGDGGAGCGVLCVGALVASPRRCDSSGFRKVADDRHRANLFLDRLLRRRREGKSWREWMRKRTLNDSDPLV